MFPTQSVDTAAAAQVTTATNGVSFLFDFATGDFVVANGKVTTVTELQGLKIWINKVLRTEKYKFKIYNTDSTEKYGISLLDLVTSGYPRAFIEAEIQREITETLLTNTEIIGVNNFAFSRVKKVLYVTFAVNSVYGNTAEEVTIING